MKLQLIGAGTTPILATKKDGVFHIVLSKNQFRAVRRGMAKGSDKGQKWCITLRSAKEEKRLAIKNQIASLRAKYMALK